MGEKIIRLVINHRNGLRTVKGELKAQQLNNYASAQLLASEIVS